MDITKRAKRWMATVMTTALALTSLVVAPKPAKAATDVPTVEVKGATLRFTETEEGTQAMRIGVVIKKADLATACGIQIGYKGKSTTIATDNGYDKIYDYDKEKQKVVYTAVITDIPSTAFADDFTITGLVKGADDEEYTTSSSVKKSINGIVESLGSDYELLDGMLVKKADEMDINSVKDGIYAWEQTVIDSGCVSESTEYKDQTCLKVSKGTKDAASVKFKFSDMNSVGRKFLLKINACSESGYKITSYSVGENYSSATDFKETSLVITGSNAGGYEQFTVQPITEGDDLYVKSFVVYEIATSLDFDKTAFDSAETKGPNQYAIVSTVTYTVGDTSPASFDISFDATDGASVNIEIFTTVDDTERRNCYGVGGGRTTSCDLTKKGWSQTVDAVGTTLKKDTVITIEAHAGEKNELADFAFTSIQPKDGDGANLGDPIDLSSYKPYAFAGTSNGYTPVLTTRAFAPKLENKTLADYKKVIIECEESNDTPLNFSIIGPDNETDAFVVYKKTGTVTIDLDTDFNPPGDYQKDYADKAAAQALDASKVRLKVVAEKAGYKGKIVINSITFVE